MISMSSGLELNNPIRGECIHAENTTMRGSRLAGLIAIRRVGGTFGCRLHVHNQDTILQSQYGVQLRRFCEFEVGTAHFTTLATTGY